MKPTFQIETLPTRNFFQSEHVIMPADDVPPGSIGWHVDCSANPLDLRPAVNAILQAIKEKLPSASSEHPLVVLLGELHDRPTTKLLLPMAASQIAAQGHRFSVAIEQDHNSWSDLAMQSFGMDLPEHLRKEPGYLHDPDGRGVLSAFLACLTACAAPLSRLDSIATLYKLSQNYKDNIRIFLTMPLLKKSVSIWTIL